MRETKIAGIILIIIGSLCICMRKCYKESERRDMLKALIEMLDKYAYMVEHKNICIKDFFNYISDDKNQYIRNVSVAARQINDNYTDELYKLFLSEFYLLDCDDKKMIIDFFKDDYIMSKNKKIHSLQNLIKALKNSEDKQSREYISRCKTYFCISIFGVLTITILII